MLKSELFDRWHYFRYHFDFYNRGDVHPLANSIVEAITDIENQIPKAGIDYIKKIASLNGKENDTSHYDQLLQILAELLIVHHSVNYKWKDLVEINYEPKTVNSKRNPELIIKTNTLEIGIEVKAPEFVKKHTERNTKPIQLPSRSDLIEVLNKDFVMLPRDNPVKDFLISANKKFAGFKNNNPSFIGVLVVVWDDFIYEPISALLSKQCGLFTDNSFAFDAEGNMLKFENVDSVIITRHLYLIKNGTRDENLPDMYRHPLDYGINGEFPYKVHINNPNSKLKIPDEVIDCFQSCEPNPTLGAEYCPIDLVQWNPEL